MIKYLYPTIISTFWILFLSYVFKASIPIPSLDSFKQKAILFNIIPQGWGFFTRDPRENEISTYYITDGSIIKFTQTNGNLNNFYGASRKNRFHGVELGLIVSQINPNSWVKMKGGKFILNQKIHTDTIINSLNPSNIKGDFFIVEQERIPWAWAKNSDTIIMPYKYAKIHVKTN
ncbi:SdpA family antimicrobial peptide system protein [Flavobacterium sp. UBA7680]|uniref:SdpA family antimicrobial peptide system protein n=1 Tax=Flavobacterium sp. UBA7680 TaxID=1946559 RepID=UPI0025C28B36|nr:SdpA family antimicrobial peptide system protein [Flavobacterium sp. UBA7680]